MEPVPVPKGFDQYEIIAIINQIIETKKSGLYRIRGGKLCWIPKVIRWQKLL
jgi:hypothetical protein